MLKPFADNYFTETQMMHIFFDLVENIVGKGENAAFSPFPTVFSKGFFPRTIKVEIVWNRVEWN